MIASPTNPAIELETVTESLLSELRELYPEQAHKEAIWHWQFAPRLGRDCWVLTARDGERLIGFNALMPINLTHRNKECGAWWSCDFIVDPMYQGRGIGSRLKDAIRERIQDPVLSMGISAQAWPILLKKGWEPGPSLFLYERVYKPSRGRQRLLQLWSGLMAAISAVNDGRSSSRWQLESVNSLPKSELVDTLWRDGRQPDSASVVKDYAYLKWRYQDFPFICYRYLIIRNEAGVLKGLLVYRFDKEQRVEITDYLGAVPEATLIRAIASRMKMEGACSVFWRVQAPELYAPLARGGFIKKRYATRFVYRFGQDAIESWNLSSGDSDGDFLGAAFDFLAKPERDRDDAKNYSVQQVSLSTLQESRNAWDTLLSESDANPLFMSWLWQTTWWSQWAGRLGLELQCHYIYSRERLVGILPLFKAQRGLFKPIERHFLGNAWRLSPTVRSEYIGPILARDQQKQLYEFLRRWISRGAAWSFLIVPDHNGPMVPWSNTLVRQRDRGYRIRTEGSLSEYLKRLGKNTRLRAFNRHEYLVETYPDATWGVSELQNGDVGRFFEQLNQFHEARWGVPCFSEDAVAFHCKLIENRSENLRPLLHFLKVHGEIRSVSYNLWIDGVMYNIQSGFDADFDRKLSLGTLHFGKLIGFCFEDEQIQALDLLAGRGKRTDYKNHFHGETVSFFTLQVFPNKILFYLYWLVAKGKSWFRTKKDI